MIRTPNIKAIICLAACASLIFLSAAFTPVHASDASGSCKVIVYLIEASDGPPGVDPQIKGIVRQFQGAFKYSTYKLVSKIPKRITVGRSEKISLPGRRELQLYPQGFEEKRIKMNVKIVEKGGRGNGRTVLNTSFRIVPGGTIMIGGYNYQKGKLILAISAGR